MPTKLSNLRGSRCIKINSNIKKALIYNRYRRGLRSMPKHSCRPSRQYQAQLWTWVSSSKTKSYFSKLVKGICPDLLLSSFSNCRWHHWPDKISSRCKVFKNSCSGRTNNSNYSWTTRANLMKSACNRCSYFSKN
jgi:hypothetical protein